ncbi:prolipoprotein diacylglyceryl transferase [Paludicola sp. MB14-C6]|uniref:prolipoprotein diacylglyceryl transferase n=1 Tax=Paludihabitans sp. MB14-C6 TaxID=3070656 RepID=UPI0027DD8D72|nr:prolipoprotein diacylglyceryl transferase [Paludicola sp. MB14-C6]WMJ23330.1 prolipoprotein diacylglyceryl transferase [Paludicola sp. MB14-C6]
MEKILEFPKLGIELKFHNSFSIGSFEIAYYGVIIALGLLLALIYALKKFKQVGVDSDKAIDAIIGGIIGGIIGARLYYVAFSWDSYKDNFWSIFDIRSGGMAIYGGIIGALLVGLIIAKIRKIKLLPLLDVVGIGFLIGQGIGRWGNFFNVEAFGGNTNMPWGMTSPSIVSYLESQMSYFNSIGVKVDPSIPVHPCFLYESIWCLVGFVILHFYFKHRKFDGEVFLMYLGYYGLGRFFIEGMRTDSLMLGTLRVSQVLAGLLVIASIIAIIVIRMKIRNHHDPEYLKLFALTEEGQAIVNAPTKKQGKSSLMKKSEKEDNEELSEFENQTEKVADIQEEKGENIDG